MLRQLQAGALEQVWIQAGFDNTHRALLKFLVANDLASLRASEVLKDQQAFIDASARVVDYLDSKGHFKGFGLDVPKSLWFVPETEQEPIDARKARLENDMAKVRDRIDIAENAAKKEQELAALGRAIQAKETILKDFNELQQLMNSMAKPGKNRGKAESAEPRIKSTIPSSHKKGKREPVFT